MKRLCKELPADILETLDKIFIKHVSINGFLHCWGNLDITHARNIFRDSPEDMQPIYRILQDYLDQNQPVVLSQGIGNSREANNEKVD